MNLLLQLISITAIAHTALADSCWKFTPCTAPPNTTFSSGPWTNNLLAPSLRVTWPKSVLNSAGNWSSIFLPFQTVLTANNSLVVFDFGIEVGGLPTLEFSAKSGAGAHIGLAFSEAKSWIGEQSDRSNGGFRVPNRNANMNRNGTENEGGDGNLYTLVPDETPWTRYTVPTSQLRGGFRYLTVFLKDAHPQTSVRLLNVQVEISFQPTWSNLREYRGYFHSSDQLLNRIWYSGAYTLQTNCIDPQSGRFEPFLNQGWSNNATIGSGKTIMVDGAKRDRKIWPGFLGTAVNSAFVSIGDLESIKNSLITLYYHQQADGAFPESGPPYENGFSDTTAYSDIYQLWVLIGTYQYVYYTDDLEFIKKNWIKFENGIEHITSKIGPSGLLEKIVGGDWTGNERIAITTANMLLLHALKTSALLADWTGSPKLKSRFTESSSSLESNIQAKLFDNSTKLFIENPQNENLYPQDANAFALAWGFATDQQEYEIARELPKYWTPHGAETPELPGNISPFISAFEIQGYFRTGNTFKALDLMKRIWGFYLNHINGTESTMIEGFGTDGTFGYRKNQGYHNDSSYVSHSHSWSTGPTGLLTQYLAGLSISSPAGLNWTFEPQFGNLKFAEAGFTTKFGKFKSRWDIRTDVTNGNGSGSINEYTILIDTPKDTYGMINLPALREASMNVTVNNVQRNDTEDSWGMSFGIPGGIYNIKVSPATF